MGEHRKSDRFLAVTRWLKDIQQQSTAHADTRGMMELSGCAAVGPENGESSKPVFDFIVWFLSRGEAVQCLM